MICTRFFVAARTGGIAWFRLFGLGLAWRDHRKHPPRLSERYAGRHGFPARRYLHLGPHCLCLTTRSHP